MDSIVNALRQRNKCLRELANLIFFEKILVSLKGNVIRIIGKGDDLLLKLNSHKSFGKTIKLEIVEYMLEGEKLLEKVFNRTHYSIISEMLEGFKDQRLLINMYIDKKIEVIY